MKQYSEYKDSCVEWLGVIPSHWSIVPLKFSTGKGESNFIDGDWIESKVIVSDGIRYLTTGNVGVIEYKEQGSGFITEDTFKKLNCTEVFPGDILISRLNYPIGRACIVPDLGYRIVVAVDNVIYRPDLSLYNKRFLVYEMNCYPYSESANNIARGSTMQRITRTQLGSIRLCIPPLPEQQAIATYLDKKCGEIDKIISTQQKRIALLEELKQSIITHAVTKGLDPSAKMKDSGVEWIGEVPEHWNVVKMNVACHVITDYVASGSFADLRKNVQYLDNPDYAMLVRTMDLSQKTDNTAKVYISKSSYKFLSNSNLNGGEVILPNIGASIGDVYLVPKDLYDKMSLAPNSIMLKSNSENKFLYYYFKGRGGCDSLLLIGMAAAQGKFNKTELRRLRVPIPPQSEQKDIIAYLDKRCSSIDSSIQKANHEIELLQEYKQSLITEVVTGKRKVC